MVTEAAPMPAEPTAEKAPLEARVFELAAYADAHPDTAAKWTRVVDRLYEEHVPEEVLREHLRMVERDQSCGPSPRTEKDAPRYRCRCYTQEQFLGAKTWAELSLKPGKAGGLSCGRCALAHADAHLCNHETKRLEKERKARVKAIREARVREYFLGRKPQDTWEELDLEDMP